MHVTYTHVTHPVFAFHTLYKFNLILGNLRMTASDSSIRLIHQSITFSMIFLTSKCTFLVGRTLCSACTFLSHNILSSLPSVLTPEVSILPVPSFVT